MRWSDVNPVRYAVLLGSAIISVYLTKLVNQKFLPAWETRPGFYVYDPVLDLLPAMDMSVPIFIVMYSTTLLGFWILGRYPRSLVLGFWAYTFMYLFRFGCIYMVPMYAPDDLVVLKDPVVDMLHIHTTFLRRDLFYSGHFATCFLLYLMIKPRWYQGFFLLSSYVVGLLILIQHIHYSYDILGAVFFSYISVYCAQATTGILWDKLSVNKMTLKQKSFKSVL